MGACAGWTHATAMPFFMEAPRPHVVSQVRDAHAQVFTVIDLGAALLVSTRRKATLTVRLDMLKSTSRIASQ
jgi:hypothetical protein